MAHEERLLTLAEVAQLLQVSKSKLYQERRAGNLRVLRFGRTIRLRGKDVRQFIGKHTEEVLSAPLR
jgi:excisionase family DNA binding protein